MSTITLKIDTEHLDAQAVQDIQAILFRASIAAQRERAGFHVLYPLEVENSELVVGTENGWAARFGFDKNKPKL